MAAHGHSLSPEEIRKHVKVYLLVFLSLAFLTFVTVAVSYLRLPIHYAIVVALVIAAIKGSLVAAYFMHLISEKKVIYWVLILTVVFFVVLLLLPLVTDLEAVLRTHVA